MSVDFGISWKHLLLLHEQLAWVLKGHTTRGNIICHLITSPLYGICAWSCLSLIFPTYLLIFLTISLAALSIANEPLFGVVYSLFLFISTYVQISLPPLTLIQSLAIIIVATFIRIFIGNRVLESSVPENQPTVRKGNSTLFTVTDHVCEIVSGTFHFYTVLALNLGIRSHLKAKVDAELERINKEIPTRTKSS